jgi:peptide/nickel transport system permease protein
LIIYVLKRLLQLIPVILAVSFIVFMLMELAPGDVLDAMNLEDATEEDIARLREMHNLDRSAFYRYGVYLVRLVQGDLGVSDVTGLSVWSTFIIRLPNTMLLALGAVTFGALVSIPVGIFAAKRAGSIADNLTTTFTMVGMAMPTFWVGLLMLLVFSYWLGWFPGGGNRHGLRSFVLPAVCSGMNMMAGACRQTRSSMLEVLKSDYLRTARAKGVPEEAVIRRHALGNAWIPIITTIGGSISNQLAGSVVIESVFAWPGIGRMAADAVRARDVTAATGVVIMTSILYVLVQLIVDILYAFVDPRIKGQYINTSRKRKRAA